MTSASPRADRLLGRAARLVGVEVLVVVGREAQRRAARPPRAARGTQPRARSPSRMMICPYGSSTCGRSSSPRCTRSSSCVRCAQARWFARSVGESRSVSSESSPSCSIRRSSCSRPGLELPHRASPARGTVRRRASSPNAAAYSGLLDNSTAFNDPQAQRRSYDGRSSLPPLPDLSAAARYDPATRRHEVSIGLLLGVERRVCRCNRRNWLFHHVAVSRGPGEERRAYDPTV